MRSQGLLLVSASGMGVLSSVCGPWARLRTSLSTCPPSGQRRYLTWRIVDRCGWEAALLRIRYTSCGGHLDHDFPGPIDIKSLQAPLIAHPSAVGHLLEGTDGTVGLWELLEGSPAQVGPPRRRPVGQGAPVQGAGIASLHARATMSLFGASGSHNGTDIRPGQFNKDEFQVPLLQ